MRNLADAIGRAAVLALLTPTSLSAAQTQFGTEKEAKAMLERAVDALKQNKEKALESFQVGIEQYRYYPDCHYFYCRALGSGDEASEACKSYVELAPNGEYIADAKKRVK